MSLHWPAIWKFLFSIDSNWRLEILNQILRVWVSKKLGTSSGLNVCSFQKLALKGIPSFGNTYNSKAQHFLRGVAMPYLKAPFMPHLVGCLCTLQTFLPQASIKFSSANKIKQWLGIL